MTTAEQRKDRAVALPSRNIYTHGYSRYSKTRTSFTNLYFPMRVDAATVVKREAVQWYSLLRWISVDLNGGKDCRDARVLPGGTRICTILLSASKGVRVRFTVPLKP